MHLLFLYESVMEAQIQPQLSSIAANQDPSRSLDGENLHGTDPRATSGKI